MTGPCKRCGAPKKPGQGQRLCEACAPQPPTCHSCRETRIHGRGARYCPDCLAIRREAHLARKRAVERQRHGKPCRGCQGVKPRGRRVVYCPACLAKRARVRVCQRCDKPARTPTAKLCVDCRRAADRKNAQRKKDWREENIEHVRALERVRPTRLRVAPTRSTADRRHFPALPAGPLAAAIEREIARMQAGAFTKGPNLVITGENGAPMPGHSPAREAVCERLGIVSRNLYGWSSGERTTVQFDVADRVLTRAGWCWWDIWTPEQAAYAFEGQEAA